MTNQQSKARSLLDTLLHAKRHKFGVLSTISLLPDEIDTLRSALALKVAVEEEVRLQDALLSQKHSTPPTDTEKRLEYLHWIADRAESLLLLFQVDSNPPSIPDHLKSGPLSSAIALGLTHEEHKAEWKAK